MVQISPDLPQFRPGHNFDNLTVPGSPFERVRQSTEVGVGLQEALDQFDTFLSKYNDRDRPVARGICEVTLMTTEAGRRFMQDPSSENRILVEMATGLTVQTALSTDIKITEMRKSQDEHTSGSATE